MSKFDKSLIKKLIQFHKRYKHYGSSETQIEFEKFANIDMTAEEFYELEKEACIR